MKLAREAAGVAKRLRAEPLWEPTETSAPWQVIPELLPSEDVDERIQTAVGIRQNVSDAVDDLQNAFPQHKNTQRPQGEEEEEDVIRRPADEESHGDA